MTRQANPTKPASPAGKTPHNPMRPLAFAAVLVSVASICGCETQRDKNIEAKEALIEQSGDVYASWMECSPRLWSAGPATPSPSARVNATGSVYIDYENNQATGTGEYHSVKVDDSGAPSGSGIDVTWKITGMRVVTMSQQTSDTVKCANPKIAVFDGDFAVRIVKGGHEVGKTFHSTSAVDLQGPGSPSQRSLALNIAFPGVSIRDGIDEEGIVFLGSILFQ